MALNANEIVLRIPRLPLVAGRYWITFFCVYNGAVADWLRQAAVLDVETSDFYKTGKTVPSGQGHFLMDYHMTLTFHSCNT